MTLATARKQDVIVRRSADRGHADHGWLNSHHTFSFAGYYDPAHMGFSDLRVINEDRVAAGGGFPAHGHRDMEIVSYVVDGALAHRDSTGGGDVIRPGEVQVMTAGTGIRHSEMNASQISPVHFLQIWVLPAEAGSKPGYRQRHFEPTRGLTLLVSPDGRDGSLRIGQDVDIHRAIVDGDPVTLELRNPRAWVQIVRGTLDVAGVTLHAGDAVGLSDVSAVSLSSDQPAEALLFDLR